MPALVGKSHVGLTCLTATARVAALRLRLTKVRFARTPESVMGVGMIGMAIFWIVVIALLVRDFRSSGQRRSRTDATPLGVLQKRYTAGEIQREEYEQKKRDFDI
jgi:putative membrane protein